MDSPHYESDGPVQTERTALLRQGERENTTPLPKLQVFILIVAQLAEPISATVIFPFINQMISELDITGGDSARVGYYVGMMFSLFYATEAFTIFHWSRLSDRIGRKPVLLAGLAGTALSLVLLGLARSFWSLLFARCLCGALNGNAGVAKSALGELTDKTNIAQAFALMPAVWAAGATIAPVIGGILQRPFERFPGHFKHPFWHRYPYFLPCFVTALCIVLIFTSVLLFLEETLPSCKPHVAKRAPSPEDSPSDTPSAGGCVDTENGNPLSTAATLGVQSPTSSPPSHGDAASGSPLRALLRSPRVRLAAGNYALLALLESSLLALQPHFLAAPRPLGGLARTPRTIGALMGAFGLVSGGAQAALFARVVRAVGHRGTFVGGLCAFIGVWVAMAGANALARRGGVKGKGALPPGAWVLVAVEYVCWMCMDLSFGAIMIYITTAAPDKHSLGATNGIAQQSASVMRAIGPALATSIFAFSFEHQLFGGYAVHVVLITLTAGFVRLGLLLPPQAWEREGESEVEVDV